MLLEAGTRLGAYEVISAIGEGGPPTLARRVVASFGEVSPKPSRARQTD